MKIVGIFSYNGLIIKIAQLRCSSNDKGENDRYKGKEKVPVELWPNAVQTIAKPPPWTLFDNTCRSLRKSCQYWWMPFGPYRLNFFSSEKLTVSQKSRDTIWSPASCKRTYLCLTVSGDLDWYFMNFKFFDDDKWRRIALSEIFMSKSPLIWTMTLNPLRLIWLLAVDNIMIIII